MGTNEMSGAIIRIVAMNIADLPNVISFFGFIIFQRINCMIEKTCDYKVPLCGTHNYKSLVSSQSFGINSYLYISNENEIALDVVLW